MTARETVKALYDDPDRFEEFVQAHYATGVVIDRQGIFVMGRPVCASADVGLIRDPWTPFPPRDVDAWFIFAFAVQKSERRNILNLFPYRLTYVGWDRERASRMRFYYFDQFKRCAQPILSQTRFLKASRTS